jgi:predicted MPP superfamily phosphohydrolase
MTPEARLVAAVLAANDFEPDVVCLTGDYIAHSLRYLDRLAHALAQLEAPVLATMGNHDHWQDARAVGRALEKAGVDVLWNESRRMEVAGASWQIVGLDDAVTANHDVERAFRDVGEGPTVVLSHLAEVAPECDPKGSGLMLSGHTHGGQVQVGKVTHHVLRRMGHDYVDGWYTSGETAIYVNRGIGASVFPFRNKHARAEVAGIELSPHNGSDAPVEIEETREDAPWGPDGPA